jgi:hypothetical protein
MSWRGDMAQKMPTDPTNKPHPSNIQTLWQFPVETTKIPANIGPST